MLMFLVTTAVAAMSAVMIRRGSVPAVRVVEGGVVRPGLVASGPLCIDIRVTVQPWVVVEAECRRLPDGPSPESSSASA